MELNVADLTAILKRKWQVWGVKYQESGKGLVWIKTKRSVNCAFCGRHEVEKEIDQGHRGWAVLPYLTDAKGFFPEVCPDCLKQRVGQKLEAKPPRIIRCARCGVKQREKIFGIGWPGWQPTHLGGALCPNCFLQTALLLGEKYMRGTWTDLTYAYGSLLTSTKMTQNQDNFTALAEYHAGAPNISLGEVLVLSDSVTDYSGSRGTSWGSLIYSPIYIAPRHKKLTARFYAYCPQTGWHGYLRLYIDSTHYSGSVNIDGSSWAWKEIPTPMDVSDLSGWQTCYIQGKAGSNTVDIYIRCYVIVGTNQ